MASGMVHMPLLLTLGLGNALCRSRFAANVGVSSDAQQRVVDRRLQLAAQRRDKTGTLVLTKSRH
jgi:hypothetical protein